MNRFFLAAIVAIGVTGLSASPAAARNYDCTKAGNANKSECEVAAKPSAATAKVATKSTTKTTTKTAIKAERNYNCSLAGNKTKAACKRVATAAMPAAKQSSTMVTRGPKSTAVTTVKTNVTPSVAKTVTMSKPVAMSRPKAAASAEDSNPVGSIGRCKDGLYSHSKVRSGACSRHGGVAKWN